MSFVAVSSSSLDLMFCCNSCERWLHFTCVNESPTDPKHANGNFELICPWCKPDPDVARRAVSFGVPLSEKEKETCSRPSCTIASHTVGRIMGRTKKGCESVFLVFWNLYVPFPVFLLVGIDVFSVMN